MLIPKVIFEDKDILVVNKPSGLVVNRAESVKDKTLQDWIEENKKISGRQTKQTDEEKQFVRRSGVVHRLDKDTSGVMVVAKTSEAFINLQKQFKEREVVKVYLSLVHGRLEPQKGDIRMPVSRRLKDRKKFAVRLGGRAAFTKYQRLAFYQQKEGEFLSLVKIEPQTGRTHQIRVHFSHLGYPLAADPLYLGRSRLKKDRQWCLRLFLHAWSLEFIHPSKKIRMTFKAELPQDLKKVLTSLRKIN